MDAAKCYPGGSLVKNPPATTGDARDAGLIPASRRSPGEGNGNPLQYSCLKNPMDAGVWRTTVCRVTNSWTQLSTDIHVHTHTHLYPSRYHHNWERAVLKKQLDKRQRQSPHGLSSPANCLRNFVAVIKLLIFLSFNFHCTVNSAN